MTDYLKDLKYDSKYLWLKIKGDEATVGIIKPAADLANEFVFIQLPEKGRIKKGDKLFSIEAMKWSGEVESPITGQIVDVNDSLFDEPAIINADPYGDGWIAKIKLTNKDELQDLLDSKQREKFKNE
ncbi:MAG: glycine cleavage system protein H [Candidatus Woesearchaeota archaeon]